MEQISEASYGGVHLLMHTRANTQGFLNKPSASLWNRNAAFKQYSPQWSVFHDLTCLWGQLPNYGRLQPSIVKEVLNLTGMERYTSWFSYPITKPYPYRWFTPVTVVGGIILSVLFSLVNLAANGYYMRTIYTNDPNTTLVQEQR